MASEKLAMGTPVPLSRTGTVFLDIDEVLCVGQPTACLDMSRKLRQGEGLDSLALGAIFSPVARNALAVAHRRAGGARYVISSSWREHFSRDAMASVLVAAGLSFVADNLAEGASWKCIAKNVFRERQAEILHWLASHHAGEPFVVLDDEHSAGCLHFVHHFPGDTLFGRVVLCKPGLGLTFDHVESIVTALRTPCTPARAGPCDAQ